MTSPQEPETPDEYLKRLNEQYEQSRAEPESPYLPPRPAEPGPAAGDAGTTQPGYGDPSYGQAPYGQPGQEQQAWGQGYPQQGQDPSAYYDPSGQYAYAQKPPAHPSSTAAMVLGLVSLVGLFFSCGVTLLAGPFAWWVGAKAVREIDASNGAYSGRDQANAGRIMGIISVVLLVLAIVGFVVFIVAMVTMTEGWSQALGAL